MLFLPITTTIQDGKTAIMSAVFQDQAAVMELLLRRGANLAIREDKVCSVYCNCTVLFCIV